MLSIRAWIPAFFLFPLLWGACTSQESAPLLQRGKPPLQFDPSATQSLSIYHSAHRGGEAWNARYSKESERWRIQSTSVSSSLTDTLADTKLIDHLLDTLKTLTVENNRVSASLDTLGLQTPDFFLEWQAGGRTFQMEIGAQDGGRSTAYVRFPQIDADHVYLVKGAAIQMIGHFRTFAETRERRLIGLELDDVAGLNRPIQAQRLSGGWGDLKNKPYSENVEDWIEAVVHLRVKRFIDRSDPVLTAAKRALAHPQWIIELIDQQDKKMTIEVSPMGDTLVARNRSRNDAIFELPSEAAQHLKPRL